MSGRKALLEHLEKLLHAAGFPTRLLPAGGDNPIEMVVVDLGADYRERRLFLELAFASAAHAAMQAQDPRFGSGGYEQVDYLQFYAELPFQVEPRFLPQVAQLVLLVNRILPLVGFGSKESERAVYYRHMMMVDARKKLDRRLIVKAIEVIAFLLQEFGQVIEEVSTGRRTLAQARTEMPGVVDDAGSSPQGRALEARSAP